MIFWIFSQKIFLKLHLCIHVINLNSRKFSSIYRVKTLQIIKSNRGPIARSTNPLPDPGRPDHEIARYVEEGRSREKRYRFKGFGGTHPFYPAQSFAIHRGSVYKRTNLWTGYPRHGWFSGFSEGFEGHDATGKLFYINRGLTGGVHWTQSLPEKERRKTTIRYVGRPSAKVWTAICSPCMADSQIRTIGTGITHWLKLRVLFRWVAKVDVRTWYFCSLYQFK